MQELNEDILTDDTKGFSVRLPEKFHNIIKAEAALNGKSKDEFFQELLVAGYKKLQSRAKAA